MNCEDCLRALARGDKESIRPHLEVCEFCRTLAQTDETAQATPPALYRDVSAKLKQDLKPVRPMASNLGLAVITAGFVLLGILLGVWLGGGEGHRDLPWGDRIAFYVSLTTAMAAVSLALPSSMIPGARVGSWHWLSIAGITAFLLAVCIRFGGAEMNTLIRTAPGCLALGTLWGGASGVLAWTGLRRGVPGWRAWMLFGLLSGISGVAGMTLHCPIKDRLHVIVAHFGCLILLAAAGLLIGRRFR